MSYREPTPEERAEYQRIHDEYLTRQIQTHSETGQLPYSTPNYQRGLIVAPINIPMPNLPPPPALTQITTGGTCNCEQSTSTCNCPTPTPTPILSPTSTPTDNKKYMYIASGLIIAFFIFSKK
jgi:hypothetical protein